jgi:hypothetical protein
VATGSIPLAPGAAIMPDGSTSNAAPGLTRRQGSETAPKKHFFTLDFDASTQEQVFFNFRWPGDYSSSPVLKIQWQANTTTASNVVWACKLGAVTPADADTPLEHVLATAQTVTTAVNTTEARRLIESSIAITNLDSVAAGDFVTLHVYRDAANGSDTCTVDAEILACTLEYTTV